MKTLRIGRFALVALYYPVWIGFGIHKWTYAGRSSWIHGSARLGRIKLMW